MQLRQAEGRCQALGFGAQKSHVERLRLLVGVFDFELGQRRAAVETPVDRLETAVDEAAFDHPLEGADLLGLVLEVHRAVRAIPLSENAQALEIGHLDRDLLGGEGAAAGLHVVARERAPELLFDRVFDGQSVAIPAGYVLRVEALELACLDDHVLEYFVDRVAHVNLAVGVGRAVVQDEFWRAGARRAQLLVDPLLIPLAGPFGFALGQVAAHRKRRLGQIQRAAVIGFFGHEG